MEAMTSPVDLWPVPGSRTLATFFAEISSRFDRGLIGEDEVHRLVQRRCITIAVGALEDMGVRDRSLIEDLAQELPLRLATMDAVEKYDPVQSSPLTYLHGVMRMLIIEAYYRRERPMSIAPDAIDRVRVGTSHLDRAARLDLYNDLYGWLDQLSKGELRAVIHEFGPIRHYSPPRTRRRLRNPEALDRAVEILRERGAQHLEQ